jgi:NADPH:quinone reductase-like Zn-dependent oxidoreductase
MQALQISKFGDPYEVLELVTVPEPAAPVGSDVVVAVEYAPISNTDLLTIRGRYGVLPSLPAGIGSEGVGRILAVGDQVNGLAVGDRVLLPSTVPTWREQVVLPSAGLFALPAGADARQLSLLRVNPPTAALLLSEYVALAPGDWVIQNAGNSGVGRSVIAFARDRGLRTVSLVRRAELVEPLRAAGGDVVLEEGPDLAARVAKATSNAKIALALDGVGGESTQALSGALAPGGTLVVYSAVSKKPGLASFVDLIFRNITIRGFWIYSPEFASSPKVGEAIKAAARLVADGKLHMPIAATYPLSALKQAIDHAQASGKVVLQLQPA